MGVFKKAFVELVVLLVILLVAALSLNFFVKDEEVVPTVQAKLNEKVLTLEIADNSFTKTMGLSGRDNLQENHGMIFVYEEEMTELSFWMKDMLIPLDIIFLNKDLEIVDIVDSAPICDQTPCPVYTSMEKTKFVLELNAGWIKKNNVEIGDKLEIITRDQFGS